MDKPNPFCVHNKFGKCFFKTAPTQEVLVHRKFIQWFPKIVESEAMAEALEPKCNVFIVFHDRIPSNRIENSASKADGGMRYRHTTCNRLSCVLSRARKMHDSLLVGTFKNLYNRCTQNFNFGIRFQKSDLSLKPMRVGNIISIHTENKFFFFKSTDEIVKYRCQSPIFLEPHHPINAILICQDNFLEFGRHWAINA